MSPENSESKGGLNRRDFLRITGAAGLSVALSKLLITSRVLYADERGEVALVGVDKDAEPAEVEKAVRDAIGAVDDLSWLKAGQTVAINVASNSPKQYPFTTHPEALKALIKVLKEKGARVVVADQAGLEHVAPPIGGDDTGQKVRQIWKGLYSHHGSGREVLKSNGLLEAAKEAGAEVQSFDSEEDWVRAPASDHWPEGIRIAKLAVDADHIVNLARPAAHVMTGHTGPIKNYYGWVHPLDRLRSHTDIGWRSFKEMKPLHPGGLTEVKHLHERVAEAAAQFHAKSRLHLVGAIGTYSDIGPDWGSQPLQQSVIIASKDMLAADAATAALVAYELKRVPEEERKKNWKGPRGWRRIFTGPRDETFWGALQGSFHDFHGNRREDEIIEKQPKNGIWEFRQLAHGREIGLGSDDIAFRQKNLSESRMLDGLENLTGAESKGIIDVLGEDEEKEK